MSTQTRILADLTKTIEAHGLEVENDRDWANTGRLSIYDGIENVADVSYEFSRSWKTMKFSITVGDKKVLSQPPRQDYHDFYMEYSATSEYKNFRSVLESELKKLTVSC